MFRIVSGKLIPYIEGNKAGFGIYNGKLADFLFSEAQGGGVEHRVNVLNDIAFDAESSGTIQKLIAAEIDSISNLEANSARVMDPRISAEFEIIVDFAASATEVWIPDIAAEMTIKCIPEDVSPGVYPTYPIGAEAYFESDGEGKEPTTIRSIRGFNQVFDDGLLFNQLYGADSIFIDAGFIHPVIINDRADLLTAAADQEITFELEANGLSDGYYNELIRCWGICEIEFNAVVQTTMLEGPAMSIPITVEAGFIFAHIYGNKSPPDIDDGRYYNNIIAERGTVVHISVDPVEISFNSDRTLLSPYHYKSFILLETEGVVSYSLLESEFHLYEGPVAPGIQAENGFLFPHLAIDGDFSVVDDGWYYNPVMRGSKNIIAAKAEALFTFGSPGVWAFCGIPREIISVFAILDAEFDGNSLVVRHTSTAFPHYDSKIFFKNGHLFAHLVSAPGSRAAALENGNPYRPLYYGETFATPVDNARAEASCVSDGFSQCVSEHHTIHYGSAAADFIFDASALVRQHFYISVSAEADFVSDGFVEACTAPHQWVEADDVGTDFDSETKGTRQCRTQVRADIETDGNASFSDTNRADFRFNGIVKKCQAKCRVKAEADFYYRMLSGGKGPGIPTDIHFGAIDTVIGIEAAGHIHPALLVAADAAFVSGEDNTGAGSHYKLRSKPQLDLVFGAEVSVRHHDRCRNEVILPLNFDGQTKINWKWKVSACLDIEMSLRAFQPPMKTERIDADARIYFDAFADCICTYYLSINRGKYKLTWSPYMGVSHYEIYRSEFPGASYVKMGEVEPSGKPYFEFEYDMPPRNLNITKESRGVRLTWEYPDNVGAPWTFKVVPVRNPGEQLFSPSADQPWVVDTLPSEAIWTGVTGLTTSDFRRHGAFSYRVEADAGCVEPGFSGMPTLLSDGNIIVWAYCDKDNVPDSFWLTFIDQTGKESRRFWAANRCPQGTLGRPSKRYEEEMLNPGAWSPLVVHTNDIELNNIQGIKFGVYKKRGTAVMYFNSIYFTPEPVIKLGLPHVGLHPEKSYAICRNQKQICSCSGFAYNDLEAVDLTGYATHNDGLIYNFDYDLLDECVSIDWHIPAGEGTQYGYDLVSIDYFGNNSSPVSQSVIVTDTYSRTEILIQAVGRPDVTIVTTGSGYRHYGAVPGEVYTYTMTVYDVDGHVVAVTVKTFAVPLDSTLDYFILDESILA
jgi:hypothetical protein